MVGLNIQVERGYSPFVSPVRQLEVAMSRLSMAFDASCLEEQTTCKPVVLIALQLFGFVRSNGSRSLFVISYFTLQSQALIHVIDCLNPLRSVL